MSERQYLSGAQERGQQRLENWRAWSRRDEVSLGYPSVTSLRKKYRPELGNVWDGEPARDEWDSEDAWAVEQIVVALHPNTREVIIGRYLSGWSLGRLEEEYRQPRWKLSSLIAQVEKQVGGACIGNSCGE